jgi:hypothetical protein
MEQKNSMTFWWIFVIKLLIATITFYIWFSYNLQEIGYKDNRQSIDYINQFPTQELWFSANTGWEKDIDELLQELLDPMHPTSDIVPQDIHSQRFQIICAANRNICNKVFFVGQFSPYDQLIYFTAIVRIIGQTDRFLQAAGLPWVLWSLQTVTINKTGGNRRWWATWHTIVMNVEKIQTFPEFFDVFTHELGHVVDLGVLQWISRWQNQAFTEFWRVVFAADDPSIDYYTLSRRNESTRLASSRSEDFCSWYAMTNPFEDFAECFNLYMNHNAYFRSIAQNNQILTQKYNFIANILAWSFLFSASADLQRAQSRRLWWRPRDTTRMRQ